MHQNRDLPVLGLLVLLPPVSALSQVPPCAGDLFPARSYRIGGEAANVSSVAIGDVNGDGHNDVLAGQPFAEDAVFPEINGKVFVYLNDGTGRLIEPPILLSTGGQTQTLETADLNHDGADDIIIGNHLPHGAIAASIAVILTDGRGGFHDTWVLPVGLQPADIELIDVTGDDELDAVVGGGDTSFVIVYDGDGRGGFVTPLFGYFFPGSAILSIAVADFNEDELLDLVVADIELDRAILSLGLEGGTFDVKNGVVFDFDSAWTVEAADMNDDEHVDFAVSNWIDLTISIFHGDGKGNFADPVIVPTAIEPRLMQILDLNDDGREDVVVSDSDMLELLIQIERGQFVTSGTVFPGDATDFAFGDLNNDNALDLVTAEDSGADISIVPGDGAGGFLLPPVLDTPADDNTDDIVIADVNADGALDLVVTNNVAPFVSILLGCRDGSFVAPMTIAEVVWEPRGIVCADFNEDKIPDLAMAHLISDKTTIWLGNGDGTFTLSFDHVDNNPAELAVEDFDGDGHLDLAIVRGPPVGLEILYGDGMGGVRDILTSSILGTCQSIAVADFNGDDWPDLVVPSGDEIAYAMNDGKGGFPQGVFLKISDHFDDVINLAAGDVNDDGFGDIILPRDSSNDLTILVGDGKGGFEENQIIEEFRGMDGGIRIADFNDDGHPDFCIGSFIESSVSIYYGDGTGHFTDDYSFVAVRTRAFDVRDINDDGLLDIAHTTIGGASVLINECDPRNARSTPGDLDDDGDVDFTDLLALLGSWGECAPAPQSDCPADLDSSGGVGFSDLLILLNNWS